VFRLFLALMIVLSLIGPGPGPALATGQGLVVEMLASGDGPASDPPVAPGVFASSPDPSSETRDAPATLTRAHVAWPGSTHARFTWPPQTAPPAWNSVTR